MSKTGHGYSIAAILGMFCVLYNPPILPINTIHLVGICSLVYLIINKFSFINFFLKNKRNYLLGIFILILCYLTIKMILQKLPLDSLAFPLYFLVDVIPFGLALGVFSHKHHLSSQHFWTLSIFVGMIQAVLSVCAFLIPPVQGFFVESLLSRGYAEVFSILAQHRMYGFSDGLTYATPVLQSIFSIIAIYLSFTRSKWYLICAGILLFSAIINARTSFVVVLIGGMALLLCSKLKIKVKVSILFYCGVVYIFAIFVAFPLLMETSPDTFKWINDGWNEISDFLTGDTSGYFSYVTTSNLYMLPSDLSIFWGTGHIVMSGYQGYYSDIGYINDLWFGGILYVLVLYPFILSVMWSLLKKNDGTSSFLGLFLLILYPALNFKGVAFGLNDFTKFLILSYVIIIMKKNSPFDKLYNGAIIYE